MRKLELLAPAKNLATGVAAIDHGADAVYIGPPQWGARAAAGNSLADIAELCRYAHQYRAKVYATVNTLLTDDELPQAARLIAQLAEVGTDAVLIQDMRLLALLTSPSSHLSPLSLHASTQADNRTAEKVQWLHEQGIRRAVLARELSVDEVAAIHRQVPPMELEVFVHGALCVSYSGLCYASEHCFGRSANRGECAQFCRMKFDLLDADGKELQHQRHLLSLKDLNLSRQLGQLIEAGAVSFKIEGRLKDVGYVKNVTAAYSQLLDHYIATHPGQYERASLGRCRYSFEPDLNRTFNRGYTTYFVHGRQPSMASFDTPKAIGPFVGHVKELRGPSFTVAGTAAFTNGDGLCFFNARRELEGFRVNRVEGNRLFPQSMPSSLRPGIALYRSNDQAMEHLLAKPTAERKIPVTMTLRATADGFALSMGDREVELPMEHQQAATPQRENIVRQLSRLGGTPYECTAVELQPADFPYFIPSSQLAAMRRMLMLSVESLVLRDFSSVPQLSTKVSQHSTLNTQQKSLNTQQKSLNSQPSTPTPLMQCRYCLRHELGYCVKHGGKRPIWREPLTLRLGDGRCFRLEFDCRKCQMNVWSEE